MRASSASALSVVSRTSEECQETRKRLPTLKQGSYPFRALLLEALEKPVGLVVEELHHPINRSEVLVHEPGMLGEIADLVGRQLHVGDPVDHLAAERRAVNEQPFATRAPKETNHAD